MVLDLYNFLNFEHFNPSLDLTLACETRGKFMIMARTT